MDYEPSNKKALAIALSVAAITADLDLDPGFWLCGEAVQLWETATGYAWTFSYHHSSDREHAIYHWHSNLIYYGSKSEAEKAMATFVWNLNTGKPN